jgi:hypothetical protein
LQPASHTRAASSCCRTGDLILAEQKVGGWLAPLRDADADEKADYIQRYAERSLLRDALLLRDQEYPRSHP